MAEGLTVKQKTFAEHYASSGNATDAARLAGYKKPSEQGYENLNKPHIAEYIAILTKPKSDARIATAAERQEFWTRVMYGLESNGIDPVTGEQIPLKMADRLKAAELLGKCQADFIERKEISGKDGAPLQVNHSVESAKSWLTDILSDLNGSAKE